eukprot:TRINITY_DN1799_c0_g1_i1.p1 TRINITY_DN1799_c0_g1~~TRINITY_DN1799_c0_g1_i1.p1  ORF type:complete len:540 (-),score=65.51 TRINITY_DN1799_c0_g1_i1:477-1988(-)
MDKKALSLILGNDEEINIEIAELFELYYQLESCKVLSYYESYTLKRELQELMEDTKASVAPPPDLMKPSKEMQHTEKKVVLHPSQIEPPASTTVPIKGVNPVVEPEPSKPTSDQKKDSVHNRNVAEQKKDFVHDLIVAEEKKDPVHDRIVTEQKKDPVHNRIVTEQKKGPFYNPIIIHNHQIVDHPITLPKPQAIEQQNVNMFERSPIKDTRLKRFQFEIKINNDDNQGLWRALSLAFFEKIESSQPKIDSLFNEISLMKPPENIVKLKTKCRLLLTEGLGKSVNKNELYHNMEEIIIFYFKEKALKKAFTQNKIYKIGLTNVFPKDLDSYYKLEKTAEIEPFIICDLLHKSLEADIALHFLSHSDSKIIEAKKNDFPYKINICIEKNEYKLLFGEISESAPMKLNSCAGCKSQISESELCLLPCQHYYHRKCLLDRIHKLPKFDLHMSQIKCDECRRSTKILDLVITNILKRDEIECSSKKQTRRRQEGKVNFFQQLHLLQI